MADNNEKKAELAKKETKPVKKAEKKEPNFVQRYYRETAGELRKVSWPTRNEAINMTGIVIIVLIAMSLYLGVIVDNVANAVVKFLIGL